MDWSRVWYGVQQLSEARSQDERLARTRALVELRYAEPWTVEALAAHACMSREHFIRAFRRTYGTTPHRFLTEQRLRAARRLLEETDLAVTDVCLEVGFSSLGSFSSLFSRRIGHSPHRYRRLVIPSAGLLPPERIPDCFIMRFAPVDSSLLEKHRATPIR